MEIVEVQSMCTVSHAQVYVWRRASGCAISACLADPLSTLTAHTKLPSTTPRGAHRTISLKIVVSCLAAHARSPPVVTSCARIIVFGPTSYVSGGTGNRRQIGRWAGRYPYRHQSQPATHPIPQSVATRRAWLKSWRWIRWKRDENGYLQT
jgi:hypothetical protein